MCVNAVQGEIERCNIRSPTDSPYMTHELCNQLSPVTTRLKSSKGKSFVATAQAVQAGQSKTADF